MPRLVPAQARQPRQRSFGPFSYCALLPRMHVGPARECRRILLGFWSHASVAGATRSRILLLFGIGLGSHRAGRQHDGFSVPQIGARQAARPTPPVSRAFPARARPARPPPRPVLDTPPLPPRAAEVEVCTGRRTGERLSCLCVRYLGAGWSQRLQATGKRYGEEAAWRS